MSDPKPDITELAKNYKWIFEQLNLRLKTCTVMDAQQRLTAHVRARTAAMGEPKNTIVAFVNNGSTPEFKAEVLKECLTAVISGKFDGLLGGVANGQANAEPVEPLAASPAPPIEAMATVVQSKTSIIAQLLSQLAEPSAPQGFDLAKLNELLTPLRLEIEKVRASLPELVRTEIRCELRRILRVTEK